MSLLLLTSLLISCIATLCVWSMGRKDPCGKPWLTALCLGILLVLPILSILPKVRVEVLQASQVQVATTSGWVIGETLVMLWGGGAILMFIRLLLSHRQLKQWRNNVEDAEDDRLLSECVDTLGVKKLPRLKIKSGLTSPVVTGILKPTIILPVSSKQWSEETKKMAILHELGHIHRRDLWIRFAADIACVLHWYNPLVWWLRSRLLSQCEYACDAFVVSSGVSRRCYITALCDVVESALNEPRPVGILAMTDHAPLKLRVDRLLGGVQISKSWIAIIAAVVTMSTALGLSLVRPAAVVEILGEEKPVYTQEEINLRHSANPFPEE